jgi:hypothetical protein
MSDPNSLKREMAEAPAEPLLPVEKKLIGWSLGIGIGLLVVLLVANRVFSMF